MDHKVDLEATKVEEVGRKSDSQELELELVDTDPDTILAVDLQNKKAVKGDDSDGKVDWNWKQRIAVFFLIWLYTGSQIPAYFIGGPLSYISADLSGTVAAGWLPVTYGLSAAAVIPMCGYFQDMIGRRYVCLAGNVALLVGCLIMALAHSFSVGIVAMSICGVGAAIGEMTALAGTSELVPVKRRPVYVALLTIMTVPFYPYVMESQLLARDVSWRWGLWICFIWNAMSFVALLFTYFPRSQTRAHTKDLRQLLTKIDYLGLFTSFAGLVLLLVALEAGGYSYPWKSARVICPLIIGVLLIVVFVVWEWKFARFPMVPGALFKGQKLVTVGYLIATVAGMNFAALLNLLPTEWAGVWDPDPVQAGIKGLIASFGVVTGAVSGNLILPRAGRWTRELMIFYVVLMTAFQGAFSIAKPDNAAVAVTLAAIGCIGVGGVITPSATLAMMACPDSLLATCVALSLAIRTAAGSIGYAIYFNVLENKLKNTLPTRVAEFAVAAGLPASEGATFAGLYLTTPQNATSLPGVTAKVLEAAVIGVRWGYSDAFKYVWYTSIPFGVLALVAACFVPKLEKHITNRIAAKID
ncbi:uncharacterized protein Z520_07489 [Fonsecaea multimorphosa CBS 102226]|uniref:Major facilitator superfamily (MFS) profile domain-containing protein n=1 Tax=Fonsecaea multimorphosa CBS 102226 TaxID=1442371 RepID=A0A0D2K173_9EURO|nr:uncharacterized protein Z520_07489 [Fonsecaea multimorphosa CBS 102226]KIX96769.1 hypothetical protein Z520_07489 [Fonsecaea multimorphosa CBS 102226]